MYKLLLSFLLCLSLTACDAEYAVYPVSVQYDGFVLPKDTSVWLHQEGWKLKILESNDYGWGGYFTYGDSFNIVIVKNNKIERMIGHVKVDGKTKVKCNVDLTLCDKVGD